jgi:hypothetical protein
MTGRILGYDHSDNTGTISADNGTRYKFTKEDWKEGTAPHKEMKVDFDVNDENNAIDIYMVRDVEAENNNTTMGLVTVLLTFLLGFIGTFISRLFIAKEPIGSTIIATAIHFIITIIFIVPLIGWIVLIAGTFYYMYANYMLVTQQHSYNNQNKYA